MAEFPSSVEYFISQFHQLIHGESGYLQNAVPRPYRNAAVRLRVDPAALHLFAGDGVRIGPLNTRSRPAPGPRAR